MDIITFKHKKALSYSELGELFGFSKAKAYQICQPSAPCMKLIDAIRITQVSQGMIHLEDLMPEDC